MPICYFLYSVHLLVAPSGDRPGFQLFMLATPPGPLSSNILEQVIYTHGAQANSAFHPFGVGK